ncbi:MAG: NUDIX hydrolase [Pseudomonadota bacterium]
MTRLRQYAALPYVVVGDRVLVLLLTSRDTGRWVIPKGWPKKRRTPAELAALEAIEEAGVEGEVSAEPVGSYRYQKRLHFLSRAHCEVDVFALRVVAQRIAWREKGQRRQRWLATDEAAALVAEPDLAELIRHFVPPGGPEPVG